MNVKLLQQAWKDYFNSVAYVGKTFGEYVFNAYNYKYADSVIEQDADQAYKILFDSLTISLFDSHKVELFAPCFPQLKAEDVKQNGNTCEFSFNIGSGSIDCTLIGDEKADSIYLEHVHNPEYGKDMDYNKLVVDNMTLAIVGRSDFDESPEGLKFKLTDSQVNDINEQLNEIAIQKLKDSLV